MLADKGIVRLTVGGCQAFLIIVVLTVNVACFAQNKLQPASTLLILDGQIGEAPSRVLMNISNDSVNALVQNLHNLELWRIRGIMKANIITLGDTLGHQWKLRVDTIQGNENELATKIAISSIRDQGAEVGSGGQVYLEAIDKTFLPFTPESVFSDYVKAEGLVVKEYSLSKRAFVRFPYLKHASPKLNKSIRAAILEMARSYLGSDDEVSTDYSIEYCGEGRISILVQTTIDSRTPTNIQIGMTFNLLTGRRMLFNDIVNVRPAIVDEIISHIAQVLKDRDISSNIVRSSFRDKSRLLASFLVMKDRVFVVLSDEIPRAYTPQDVEIPPRYLLHPH
jgi:hypothetical protein